MYPSKSNSSKLNVQKKDHLPNFTEKKKFCMKLLDNIFHHSHGASSQNNRCSNMQTDQTRSLRGLKMVINVSIFKIVT